MEKLIPEDIIKDNNLEKEILINSLKYLPEFLQKQGLMKDAAKLLDACLQLHKDKFDGVDVLKQIHDAYCDTLYKIAAYQNLSYAAKTELLKEKGFDYLLDLLKHIYEEKYNQLTLEQRKRITLEQYLEQQTESNLANITMLFNLLYILKGKTLGLELALELVNCPEFIYITWDTVANFKGKLNSFEELPLPGGDVEVEKGDAYTININGAEMDAIFNGVSWHKCTTYKSYTTPRQPFTAELTIWGLASSSLQAKIAEFVRYYMLPYIEVKLEFTGKPEEPVYCFASGDRSLLRSFNLSNYYKDNGEFVHKDLSHDVSQMEWKYGGEDTTITMGKPLSEKKAFQGTVDLNNSFIQRGDEKIYLYGQNKTVPEFITGPALESLNDGKLTFNDDYVQAPLQEDYVLVNVQTGDQINPTYDAEGNVLDRDTIIRYNTCILVEGIHQARTIEEMGFLFIQDFDRYLDEAEVWGGRTTLITTENPAGVMSFETSTPYVREKCGVEETIHLKYVDAFAQDYTGIGDLGILGSNTYFIYNGMLFKNDTSTADKIVQIGDAEDWTDIGASHAVSETYFTPAIKGGKLVYVKDDVIEEISRDAGSYKNYKNHVTEIDMPVKVIDSLTLENLPETLNDFKQYVDLSYWDEIEEAQNWTHVTGYINEYYTAYAICDGRLYSISLVEGKPYYSIVDEEQGWTYITGAFYASTYNAYGIKNGRLYILDVGAHEVYYNGQPLVGWDSSFDCISRYHHNNDDYTTYGICAGKLYSITNSTVECVSNETGWTAICGFYNENSPRTYAYAIKGGKLYELVGNQIIEKDSTHNWTDISGCTTATNNFVLGIADSNLYMINKTKLELIDAGDWTDVFGRYTTSTANANNCFGYGIKGGRLHILHKDLNNFIVPGMWKKDGVGPAVNLEDYNITNIGVKVSDGHGHETIIHGLENVRTSVPIYNEPQSTYDIDVTYETVGFENNEKYQIKTSMSSIHNSYIDPQFGRMNDHGIVVGKRPNTYTDHCDWNSETGMLDNFTNCPLIIHGNCKINGNGDAYEFSKDMYLEIPEFTTSITTEFEVYNEVEEITSATFKVGAIIDVFDVPAAIPSEKVYPIILDKDGDTGIYYGFQPACTNAMFGLFLKSKNNVWTRLKAPVVDPTSGLHNVEMIVDYKKVGNSYTVNNLGDVNSPKFIGGNGTISGDGIVFLLDSKVTVNKVDPHFDEHKWNILPLQYQEVEYNLYENGKYFSVETLKQNLVERIITSESQESQKTIEIKNGNKKVIDLEMDMLYTTRSFETDAQQLEIKDDYAYKNLHYGYNEGIETSTLVFAGDYTLDPEKAKDNGNIKYLSDYGTHTLANKFSNTDFISVNPYNEDPLIITTGDNVENQILFQTEEGTAYTNKYLLTSKCEAVGNRDQAHGVPSGIIYELDTDAPGIVEHNLEYNCEEFKIDEEKIQGTSDFTYDSYTAILSGLNNGLTNAKCTIPLELTQISETTIIDNGKTTLDTCYETLPILNITTGGVMKQKFGQMGDEDIIIGNQEFIYYDRDNNIIPDLDAFLAEHEEDEEEEIDPNEPYQPLYTSELVTDPSVYPFEQNTNYYLKFDIERKARGIQYIEKHETTSTEEKDKFRFVDGSISNFSCQNYLITQDLKLMDGLILQFTTDDDISKDQGLFGFENGQSVCIKDNHLCLCDNNGNVIETSEEQMEEFQTFSLVFRTDIEEPDKLDSAYIYVKDEDYDELTQIFESPIKIENNMWIGFASAGTGMLPFNGSVDLTRSYVTDGDLMYRLYDFTQITTIYISKDKQNWDIMQVFDTRYAINKLFVGYEFGGTLDLYKSELLLPYTLEWLENRISINTVVRQRLAEADPTYDPEMDTNIYTMKEYGIHFEDKHNVVDQPQRWDTVKTTYTTEDNAYYMEPNKKYYIKTETLLDENGVYLVQKHGNPTWNSGIVSFENGYYSINFDDEQYLVLDVTTKTIENQVLCQYVDPTSPAIIIKDGKWQYFDDTNYHVICNAQPNTQYFFKLPHAGMLQYSLDGTNWVNVKETTFTGFDTFNIGKGFKGTINFNTSYTVTDKINYLFTLYKKIMPYISEDGINWIPLTLEPLLTINGMIDFGQGFSGTLHLYESNLLLEDSVYWTTNKINVYAMNDMPEDNILKDELVRSTLRDRIIVDYKYWTEDETVKVNPADIKLNITGLPVVGDVITLIYDTKFLFGKLYHEYDFKVTYKDRCIVSYYDKETQQDFILYEMEPKNYTVNTGFNFWGTLSVKDSTRDGLPLCEHLSYRDYIIQYKKETETEWQTWSTFYVESRYNIYVRTGFELKGPLFMETSYVKLGNLITPFLASWDSNYITVVGGVEIKNGVASFFSDDNYLLMKNSALQEGDIVSFSIKLHEMDNQGIGSQIYLKDSTVYSGKKALLPVYENYKLCLEYHIQDGKAKLRLIGNNTSNFKLKKSDVRKLTIIPYNRNRLETQSGYYITTQEQADKVQLFYRIGDINYDHYTPPELQWYPIVLKQVDKITYFGTTLKNVFIGELVVGYTYDRAMNAINHNIHDLEYLDNDTIEYKLVTDSLTTYNNTIMYGNKIEKQKTEF